MTNELLLTEGCPLCGGLGEVLNKKVRAIGYTLAEGETIDEALVPCPLCGRVKAQLAKADPLIRKDERERIINWLYEHNTLKYLDHAKHRVGLDLTYEDWQALKEEK